MNSLNISQGHVLKWLKQRRRMREFSTTVDLITNREVVTMMNYLGGVLRTTDLTQARVDEVDVALVVSTDLVPRTHESYGVRYLTRLETLYRDYTTSKICRHQVAANSHQERILHDRK